MNIMEANQTYEYQNISYWSNRAGGYSQVNQSELQSNQNKVWGDLLENLITSHCVGKTREEIKVLDIGTGPGFFAIILAAKGYSVTAVDYTDSMIKEAKKNAGVYKNKISFLQMNAEELTFDSNTFDVIVTRNLTWNLKHPQIAYSQWERVLKSGGMLLNFDANWYNYLYNSKSKEGYLRDRENIKLQGVSDETDGTDISAMESIAMQAPLSAIQRPQWDTKCLEDFGMEVEVYKDIWQKVWTYEEKVNNASTPMFLIKAIKKA